MKDIKLKIDLKFYSLVNKNRDLDFFYTNENLFNRDSYYFLLAKFNKLKSTFDSIHFYIN